MRLSARDDKPICQLAADLGIHPKMLYRWGREMRESRTARTRFAPGNDRARDEALAQLKRELAQVKLERDIEVHAGSNQRFGAYKVYRKLTQLGWWCGRHRVARLMRQYGLQSWRVARFNVTTRSQHNRPVAPNVLNCEFSAQQPNRKWVSDITDR